jgi:hypothetical protein
LSYACKCVLLATAGDPVFTGDPEGLLPDAQCAHGREGVELSNGRGTGVRQYRIG